MTCVLIGWWLIKDMRSDWIAPPRLVVRWCTVLDATCIRVRVRVRVRVTVVVVQHQRHLAVRVRVRAGVSVS